MKMKLLVFLLFVAVANAGVLSTVPSTESDDSIQAPILTSLTAQDPYGFQIEWNPVESDKANPILGYKVNVWELPRNTVYKFETIDGAKVLVKEESTSAKFPLNEVPQQQPKEVLITMPNIHKASSVGLEPGLLYEFRVQGYTKNGYGPLSAPMRLMFHKPDDNDAKDEYNVA